MLDFKEALIKFSAPRLSVLGYQYDEGRKDRDLLYGFQKELKEGVRFAVVFQRQQYGERAVGHSFTIELIRGKTLNIRGWQDDLRARLGEILWFVYDLRLYPSYNYWWHPTNAEEYEENFTDALDKLERYGIPWLEDPNSKNPNL